MDHLAQQRVAAANRRVQEEWSNARTSHFGRKSRVFDRENP
jgi:hypothetical protein